jgi:hypothetical protein
MTYLVYPATLENSHDNFEHEENGEYRARHSQIRRSLVTVTGTTVLQFDNHQRIVDDDCWCGVKRGKLGGVGGEERREGGRRSFQLEVVR